MAPNKNWMAEGTNRSDTIPPPWDHIYLTGAMAKIVYWEYPQHKFPWLPVGGAVTAGGVITYFLLREKPTTTPQLSVTDDFIDISCDGSGAIDVLLNDSGEGISIQSVSLVTVAEVTFNASTVFVDHLTTTSGFEIQVTVTDKFGQTATSTLMIQVTTPVIQAVDDVFETPFGQPLAANILTDDVGQNITVTNYSQPDGGTVVVEANGTFSFTPTEGFQGITTFGYTISGPCDQTSMGIVTITVLPPGCDFTVTTSTTPAHCGEADGTATITVDPAGAYSYAWSNGASGAIENLEPGTYIVTVTSADGFCMQTYTLTIAELPAQMEATFETTPSNCGLDNGAINTSILPEGAYDYEWSNGSMTQNLQNLSAGSYSLTLTNTSGCTGVFSASVGMIANSYLENITTSPGNCEGGGEISLTLSTPGTGMIVVEVTGPEGLTALSLSPGPHDLSSSLNIPSGDYSFTIYDEQAGPDCSETATATVADNTQEILAVDDDYQTPYGTPFTANVLTNDSGENLSVSGFTQPDGGMVSITEQGDLSFVPEEGFSGQATFNYTLSGICDQTVMGTVTITVLPPGCDFTVTPGTTPAHCGEADGTATITVDPAGAYTYMWSNGGSSASETLGSGTYTVTVTSPDGFCMQTFSITVEELPAPIEASFETTPANCGLENGIIATSVLPEGSYEFVWSEGSTTQNVQNLAVGDYSVTLTNEQGCTATFSTTVGQIDNTYLESLSTSPGNCEGGGHINLTLSTPGTGMIAVEITAPEGTTQLSLSPGSYDLSSFMNIPSGDYSITLFDEQAGPDCSETVETTVPDNTQTITATDDTYQTAYGTPLSANVLTNDIGENLSVTGFTQPDGGMVSITEQGLLTFVPLESFSGITIFSYTLTGMCGQTTTGIVTITVLPPDCNFMVSTTTTPAHCGETDGMATLTVDPSGAYTYMWSNGGSSASETLGSGTYTVTVTSPDGFCVQEINLTVDELPPLFDATFETVAASCGVADGMATISVQPDGMYDILWSNGNVGAIAENLSEGTYSTTVSDENGCMKTYEVSVAADPAAYVFTASSIPGNCLGEGAGIMVILQTPGVGPMQIEATGPSGTFMIMVPPGTVNLQDHFTVIPGDWQLTVIDQSIGGDCQEQILVTVGDNTTFNLADDAFQSFCGQVLSGNLIDNDDGTQLSVTDFTAPGSGQLEVTAEGDFTFEPAVGFTGQISFEYTAEDACGNTGTAMAILEILAGPCTFEATFVTTSADCGVANGSIEVSVNEPGSFTYEWSNGDSGPVLSLVAAGTYEVTITHPNGCCIQTFSVDLDQNPAMFVSNVVVTQPQCGLGAEIQFDFSSVSPGPWSMDVIHPGGEMIFSIVPGTIQLSPLLVLAEGMYSVTVIDESAGVDCTDGFEAVIQSSSALEIALDGIVPPSGPTADDGMIIIAVSSPTNSPYTIMVNEVFWGVTSQLLVSMDGFGVGFYNIQFVDSNGCLSNVLSVEVPVSGEIQMSVSMTNSQNHQMRPEFPAPPSYFGPAVYVAIPYRVFNLKNEFRVGFVTRWQPEQSFLPLGVRMEHFSELIRWQKKQWTLSVYPGVHIDFNGEIIHPGWNLNSKVSWGNHKLGRLDMNLGVRSNLFLEQLNIDFGVSVPLKPMNHWIVLRNILNH